MSNVAHVPRRNPDQTAQPSTGRGSGRVHQPEKKPYERPVLEPAGDWGERTHALLGDFTV